jgi:hypothetical protein
MNTQPPAVSPPHGVRLNAWVFTEREISLIRERLADSLGLASAEAAIVLGIIDFYGGLRRYQEDVYTDRPIDGWETLCQQASATASMLRSGECAQPLLQTRVR